MKKLGWILGCALLVALGSRLPAQAQRDDDLRRNWELRLGFFIPEREQARAREGDIWLNIGAEREFYQAEHWSGTISIDYYGSGSIYNVPITLNVRTVKNRLRLGAGAGIGVSHDLNEGILGFAANLLAGYTLVEGANPLNGDVRWHYLSTGGGQLNGWSFTLGYRF